MAQAHLEQFRIPREQVNVEEAARQAVWYQILHAKATQMLSRDPAQRDLLLAQQNSRLTKDALDSSAFLQADNNPDTYLATADEWLREHEELRTMEEAMQCCGIAFTAAIFHSQYKIARAFGHHKDLLEQCDRRVVKLWDEFYADFARPHALPDPRPNMTFAPLPLWSGPSPQDRPSCTAPSLAPAPRHVGGHKSATASGTISQSEREALLANPTSLVGQWFLYSPPLAEDLQIVPPGFWQVQSVTASWTDEGVDVVFEVLAEAEKLDCTIPMGKEDLEVLLSDSSRCAVYGA